jgi:hypothetical protein
MQYENWHITVMLLWKLIGMLCVCISEQHLIEDCYLSLLEFGIWDGKDKSFKFTIRGRSDSNYATDPKSPHSVTATEWFI